jgi:hypothetical protein
MTVPENWPVTITDAEGELVEIDILPSTGRVYIGTSPVGVLLDAAAQERFAQVYVAACHEAGSHD